MAIYGCVVLAALLGATSQSHYYAHDTVVDSNGVIAPWYSGPNGQFDYRVRIAAETLKRYPWVTADKAVSPGPEYIFNGSWNIDDTGTISIPPLRDWDNGDLGQRAAYVLSGFVDYYRYTGDAAALAHISLLANHLLKHCQTPADHPWPRFLISVPTKGEPYGDCDPSGMIQLDIVAEVGLALLRAYQLSGEASWFEACKHWGDLLAEHRDLTPGMPPWNRYANPEASSWDDHMTGGVVFLLVFFDELIRLGYTGANNAIVEARDAGRDYLRDALLPKWTVDDTWGRNYWDWWDSVQAENVTEFSARYLIEHPEVFPNWKTDARNIVSLFFNRTSVSPASNGDVYSGAWAFPESSGCCGRSLWYGPMEIATVLAQYGVTANDAWARELARRQQILTTYDVHDTGVVEDNIDSGFVVAGAWFKIAHPMALKHVLGTMGWLPEIEGANRENHIMRSSSVVTNVLYGDGRIEYDVYDAPKDGVDVLRLAFTPTSVTADEQRLDRIDSPINNGFIVKPLAAGDAIVTVRHDGLKHIVVEGEDPQQSVDGNAMKCDGAWSGATVRATETPGVSITHTFTGNQVRVIGSFSPNGGLADVFLDGVQQLVSIDCWSPISRSGQVLYYKNGLTNSEHTIKIVARGAGNPVSSGKQIAIESVQWSDATGDSGSGSGSAPTETQRMIFGRPERADYADSLGHAWRPATEWVARLGHMEDIVNRSWWTRRRRLHIANTAEPEIYRYGAHAGEFWVNLTVGPGTYYVRLKFAETRDAEPKLRAVTIFINGVEVVTDMDIAATAGGANRAVDLVFNGIQPKHGTVEIRFINRHGGEAIVQALEIGQGNGGEGAAPVQAVITTDDKKGKTNE